MKSLLPLLLILIAAPAAAEQTIAPKRLVIGESSQLSLQGWTRLNGTADFDAPSEVKPDTQPVPQAPDEAARRARILKAEAAYQAQKRKSKSGW